VQLDSLVFVAIVAGWVAVLFPHWVARRDALAESRGPDRDSEQMRVLPRRESSHAAAARARSSSPLLSAPHRSRATPVITTRHGEGLLRRPVDRSASRRAAVRRARVLLTLSVLALSSWAAVALPAVPWWVGVPASALLVLDAVVLVISARRRATARRATARRVAERTAAAQRRLAERAERARRDLARAEQVLASRPAAVNVDERPSSEPGPAAQQPDDTWTPIPVPRPTYMLKPVVPRPDPVPLEPELAPSTASPAATSSAPAQAKPKPWDTEHTWADDLDVVLARRRAVNG
jgi:hypothetical protein